MYQSYLWLKERLERYRFQLTAQQIQHMPPLEYEPDASVTIVSMVSHNALNMYLISITTFINNFGYGTIEVIDDGTLTTSDHATLTRLIPGVRITQAKDVDTRGCPTYISWKRLFRIIELMKTSYVIQLDSDIISLAPLYEIHDKVTQNHGFVAGSQEWGEAVDVHFLHAIIKHWRSEHVQVCAERAFIHLDFFRNGTRYLRGCAGFCGYPKQSASADILIQLSQDIAHHIGAEKWASWGSEQTASLCLISQSDCPTVLPWPKYQNYRFPPTGEPVRSMTLVHFIGSNRFKTSDYRKLARQAIRQITQQQPEQAPQPLIQQIGSVFK
ncbi:hypothetical protein [Photobacterium sp. 1_MG-2023]|uniref:hypothetical protein n=1 Tax=Photobacterium sp. 1_MG-2023 TaxID=3062646 RepID=UPI0026E2292A|nr:hypothetical protein [Photobacterium sp. 1_MG-2023]MDO6705891.1 hypothetical protein [Photobacterium sp. 1_MG-2023]